MSTSTFGGQTVNETLAKALNETDPNRLMDALRLYGFGMHLSPQKYTWLGTTGATAVNITSLGFFANASGGAQTPPLPQGATAALPPILMLAMMRVTTGPSGSVGSYFDTDPGGPLAYPGVTGGAGASATVGPPGICQLSDDGTTLTFPAQVSGFVIEYLPRSYVNVLSPFERF